MYVDAEYVGYKETLKLTLASSPDKARERLALGEEFDRTRVSFESAAETLDEIFESLRNGDESDISAVQLAINPLIEGVFRNQEAVAALLRLKESGEYRYHHGVSMAVWAAIVGRHIGLHRHELETLAVGCAMCDVGMTQLPAELLDQADDLSDEQLRIIRAHPRVGAELVSKSKDIDMEILGIIEKPP